VPKLLLDANLSPKTARFLAATFGFDVVSLLERGLGELPDHEVIRLARFEGRIVITLDEDFIRPFSPGGASLQGVTYLDLPNTHRYVPEVNRVLERFFRIEASSIDLERALVTITEQSVDVVYRR
jgi:predicted nuclease of predicted toxin-antitoxin system